MRLLSVFFALCLLPAMVAASEVKLRYGWVVIETEQTHADLLKRLIAGVKVNNLGIVTQAGPTATARKRGIDIPENRVVGVFNNDYAVRILKLSTAAMIEAPLRFYVTEERDGTATLSYKIPSFVFMPYFDEGGAPLKDIAGELDLAFERIAAEAAF